MNTSAAVKPADTTLTDLGTSTSPTLYNPISGRAIVATTKGGLWALEADKEDLRNVVGMNVAMWLQRTDGLPLCESDIAEVFPFTKLHAELRKQYACEQAWTNFLQWSDPTLTLNLRKEIADECLEVRLGNTGVYDFVLTKAMGRGIHQSILDENHPWPNLVYQIFWRIKQPSGS